MPEERSDALARLVSMVTVIDRHPGITVEELAAHFGRSKARIRADIALLDRAGFDDLLPGRTFDIDYDLYLEKEQVRLHTPLNLSSPLPLTDREFALLLTGVQALAPTLDDDELALLPSTLSSLVAMRRKGDENRAVGSSVTVATTLSQERRKALNVIHDALSRAGTVSFHYLNAAGVHSDRVFTPLTLVAERDGWVTSGWCHSAGGSRTFRLDRMTKVRLMDPSDAEGSARPTAVPSRTIHEPEGRDRGQMVTVTLDPQAQWAVHESPAFTVTTDASGQILATYRVWDERWFLAELLLLAPYVLATDPPYLQEAAGALARRALQSSPTKDIPYE